MKRRTLEIQPEVDKSAKSCNFPENPPFSNNSPSIHDIIIRFLLPLRGLIDSEDEKHVGSTFPPRPRPEAAHPEGRTSLLSSYRAPFQPRLRRQHPALRRKRSGNAQNLPLRPRSTQNRRRSVQIARQSRSHRPNNPPDARRQHLPSPVCSQNQPNAITNNNRASYPSRSGGRRRIRIPKLARTRR